MKVQRDFAERIENMVNATKLTQMQQKELNDKLIDAVKNGDIKNVRELIENGADVNAKDKNRWTALHEAALNGNIDAAKFLIENGANVDVAKVLIEKGADVDAKNNDGGTALHWAALNDQI